MAAKIRLKKVGRRGQPSYRVVVLDGRKPRDAKVVADLGPYDPKTNPATFKINGDVALEWLLKGAKPTRAARDILSKAGVMAAWDAAKRGKTVAIEAKELKPTSQPKRAKAKADDEAVGAEVPVADETPAEVEETAAEVDEASVEAEETAVEVDEAPAEAAQEPDPETEAAPESAEETSEGEAEAETDEPETETAEPEEETAEPEAVTEEPEAAAADDAAGEEPASEATEDTPAAEAASEEGEGGEEEEEKA